MPNIKTPSDQAAADATIAIHEAVQAAKQQLDREAARILEDLKTRDAAIATLSGLVERCKHVLVKDVTLKNEAVALSELRLRCGNYYDLQFVAHEGKREDAPHLRTYDDPPTTYRIWLCIEELVLP